MAIPNKEWEFTLQESFSRGIDATIPADKLVKSHAATALNLRSTRGVLQSDTGYVTYNSIIRGIPQKTTGIKFASGTERLLLITTDTVYWDNTAVGQWQYIKGTAATAVNGAHGAGAIIITVASSAGFADGDYIGIELDNGLQAQVPLAASGGVPDGTHLVLASLLSVALSDGAVVTRAVILTGLTTKPVCAVTWPDATGEWLVFTNGIDEPQRYDGTDCIDVPGLTYGGTIINSCRWLMVHKNQLFLFNTTEGGSNKPRRIRRCDAADGSTWDHAVGVAGFEDIAEDLGHGQAAHVLGNAGVLYFERGIVTYHYTGNSANLWRYDVKVKNEGLIASAAVATLSDQHIFVGNNDVYTYRGDYSVIALGRTKGGQPSAVQELMLGVSGDLAAAHKNKTFLHYVKDLAEVWVVYPAGDATEPSKMLRYSLRQDSWTTREFASTFSDVNEYKKQNAVSWDDLTGNWDSQSFSWEGSILQADGVILLLCSTKEPQGERRVYSYNFTATTEISTPINWLLETGDFISPSIYSRLDFIDILASGTEDSNGNKISVDVSTDSGATWSNMGQIAPGGIPQQVRLYKQKVGRKFRFRLSGQITATIEWLGLRWRPESQL